MTETPAETVQEPTQEQILKKQIADATDRYVAELTAVGKKWAEANGKKFGRLPTPLKPSLVSEAEFAIGGVLAVRAHGAPMEPNPIGPGLASGRG